MRTAPPAPRPAVGSSIIARRKKSSAIDSAGRTRWAREDEDVQLMLRFQAGEHAAFEELVRRNTVKVHGLIYRFLGEADQAEDLAQEVFLRVYRTVARYTPTAKFSTWLYRITANLCFNVLRSRRKGMPVYLETVTSEDGQTYYHDVADESAHTPSADLDADELRVKVAQAIAALPENQRVAIILNKYELKSYEDIADVLDCSTMAVKSLLSRARTNLRDALLQYLKP